MRVKMRIFELGAKTIEPAEDYILPFGIGNVVLAPSEEAVDNGESVCIITYGMGVYWAQAAAEQFPGQVEVIDIRTLFPLDEELIYETVKKHGKVIVLTEEQLNNSFAQALSGKIGQECFRYLDAPVQTIGALNLPCVPINLVLEEAMLPNPKKVAAKIAELLAY